ncbi:hypothetical protein ACFYNX_26080 [Streptomyces sp. NPDC007872]|uniref:hypothetical protein n=1 Tax=Streptomyces sp. NPDC007872 TaxID=3364782 RepID=UPI0036C56761
MLDPELLERITARRAELDELEEQLAKQLTEVRTERDELAVAERVLERMTGQLADLTGHDRSGGLPHGGDDALVVPRERVLLDARLVVRDQHHRPSAHLPRCRRG